ncbi:MAG: BatA and WFA domain-containing protein [Lentisphaeria bacterium]|nr:BatA and WFA domain-containing protein [Lentisphaeria bacterium]
MITFAFPLFLSGLAALAIPVALHLMNRQVPVRLRFPSIRFITKARLPREGRRRLRDLIVLLLRLLFLVAVVLAFARPQLSIGGLGADDGEQGGVTVFLLDSSASMGGWGRSEAARRAVVERLSQCARGERVGLLISSRGVEQSLPLVTSRAELDRALKNWQPGLLAGEHKAAWTEALAMLGPSGVRRLVVVSDFQQGDWQAANWASLPTGCTLELIDVARDDEDALGVVAVQTIPLAEGAVRVVATIRNFSATPQERSVSLRAGENSQAQVLSLPPLQTRNAAFVLKQRSTDKGVVRIDADGYTPDDEFHLWLGARPPVKILAVVPREQEPRKANEFFFLKKALAVQDETNPLAFSLDSEPVETFFAVGLEEFRAVLLLGAAGYFEEAGFEHLKEYVTAGGSVIVTPGEAAATGWHGLRRNGLLRSRFNGIAGKNTAGEVFGLDWINPDGILADTFLNAEETDLFLFAIRRYVRFEPSDDVQTLLKTIDGDPALVERGLGAGRIYASAFAFEPSWSDFPLTQSFLPVIRELLASAVPDDHGIVSLDCGQAPPELLVTGEGREGTDTVDTSQPGVTVAGEQALQVNVSRRESVLRQANLYDLRQRLTAGATADDAEASEEAAKLETKRELWPFAAVLAAMFLLSEMLLTTWLDRRELVGKTT